jgi:tetratricopeptide (TPR) repeat protein
VIRASWPVAERPRFGYAPMMLRSVTALAFVCLACSSPPKQPKPTKPVVDKGPNAKALVSEARDHAKNGDLDAADKAYADAYAATPDMEIFEERVTFLVHNGRTNRAQEIAKAYVDSHLTDAKGYQLLAEALIAAGRGADALEVTDQLLQIKPNDPVGFEKRGTALILQERNEEGLEMLRKAKDADPKNPAFHVALGKALDQLKNPNEAALEFQAALNFAPDNADIFVSLGRARREQGEFGDAKTYLDKAIELDRNSGRAYFEMGLLYDKENKESDAEQALAQAVQKSPNESIFWYVYGEVLRGEQRFDDALKVYKQAVSLENPYPKAVQKYVPLLIERKQYDEAEDLLTKAIHKDPRGFANYFNLGTLYAAQKKYKLAVENFQKYLDLAPKSDGDRAKAQKEIGELKRRGG